MAPATTPATTQVSGARSDRVWDALGVRLQALVKGDARLENLPYQGGVFPGQYGAARIFYYNSVMRRYLRIPQFAAVMGPCIAGGAYLPALSDVILMVEGTSFMGLGGPNLVKGATGQIVEAEELGGAHVHTEVSAVAHYLVEDDEACIERLRQLVAELPDEPRPARVSAWVNADEVKSVVLNLVMNALDSMDDGGTLTVQLGQRDSMAEVQFTDTGCGMTAEVLENIFEPFFTRSRSGKGTGLGLTITHMIINQHGGDIEATSAGPDQGSTFTVRLPMQQPDEAAELESAEQATA